MHRRKKLRRGNLASRLAGSSVKLLNDQQSPADQPDETLAIVMEGTNLAGTRGGEPIRAWGSVQPRPVIRKEAGGVQYGLT